jgi:NAD(P) transhydrogenase subunit alpha
MLVTNLAILTLAGFAGYLTISKVPNTLHTPLMSGTNAVHGIVLLGAIIVLGLGVEGVLNKALLVVAVMFGTINVVGGFLVTDRMLEMFRSKPKEEIEASEEDEPKAAPPAEDEDKPEAEEKDEAEEDDGEKAEKKAAAEEEDEAKDSKEAEAKEAGS